jgi:tol-pal system protein YbgF
MWKFLYILSAVFCLLAGCVSTSDLDQLRSDVNSLKRETYELRKETSDIKRDLNSLKEQSTGVVKEESFNAIRESQTLLLNRITDLSKDLQILSGRFEESKFFIDKSLKEWSVERELLKGQINSLEARLKEMNDRIARLSEQKPSSQKVEDEAKKIEGPVEEKKEGIKGEPPLKAYEEAYNLFKEKKYREARERFNSFLKEFPKNDLADNAQFWIGETYYAEKDYEGAILAYEAVIKNYPQSEKLPGAMLKQGMAFLELGDKKTAKVILERLIEKFPDSKEAEMAKKKKRELETPLKKKR